ncbi:LANO_0E09912g1_1 [Lachancea nothofagi CBS 11611]|uniref:LANO_0E09912g1_1 n=1 Tax=Lachancea nothofagi CBS 11611 TaxID=1266666 RepID=A0A1G4JW76_9SACH|nr:LANO_0E09912g1_1 [Lachancea nothofagi CBS 11611]
MIVILVAAFSISIFLYNYVLYPLLFNKLIRQKVPGPWLYKLSSVLILNDTRLERRSTKLQQLHAKYGPVVMIGPKEVSLNSQDLMKKVYLRNFPKEYIKNGIRTTGFYSQFSVYGEHNMFSTGDNATHLSKKRPLQKLFSKTSILSSENFIRSKVDAVSETVKKIGPNSNVDVYSLFISLAMDVVTGFEYGTKFSTDLVKELSHSSKNLTLDHSIFNDFQQSNTLWFYVTLLPTALPIISTLKGLKSSTENAYGWMYDKFEQSAEAIANGEDVNLEGFPVPTVIELMFDKAKARVTNDPEIKDPSSNNTVHQRQMNAIASEIADQVVAGHETTGTTLAYLFWELSRPANAHWQALLRKDVDGFKEFKDLESKLILNAILQEIYRLHPAIPGLEPRFVPPGNSLECALGQKNCKIPEGTIVSCQPWTLHRLPVFGSEPDKFKPERWLKEDGEPEQMFSKRIQAMNSALFTFGQGNRMCIGMHLAICQMKLCVALLYTQFQTRISPDWCPVVIEKNSDVKMGKQNCITDIDKMSMADVYTTHPLHDECWLQFEEARIDSS